MTIGGITLIVGAIFGIWYFFEKKRTEALQALADSMNFSFSKEGNLALLPSGNSFHLFSQGRSKKVFNLMSGTANEIKVTIMDYKYTTGHGKNSKTWQQTVLLFQSPNLNIPEFVLRPENFFHKIGSAFGYQDIDFETSPVFSSMFLLRGPDEQAIRDFFNKKLLFHYEQNKGLCTEGKGDSLLVYRASKRLAPAAIRVFLEKGFRLFGMFSSS